MEAKYKDLADVLRETREFIKLPGNDFSWSGWKDTADALAEIDGHIADLEAGKPPKAEIGVLFAPTGPVQEVSMSNGWSVAFLKLADRFDAAVEKAFKADPPATPRARSKKPSVNPKFQDLIDVLSEIRGYLTREDNNFDWTRWKNADEAVAEFDGYISSLKKGVVPEFKPLFAPTASLDEVATWSSWEHEYLKLFPRFYAALEKASKADPTPPPAPPKKPPAGPRP